MAKPRPPAFFKLAQLLCLPDNSLRFGDHILTGIERSFGAVVHRLEYGRRQYLLVHHSSGGHWDHPKGHPEVGESPTETALREIAEETGYQVTMTGDYYTEVSRPLADGRIKIVGYFIASPEKYFGRGSSIQDGEILELQWLSYAEARQTITWEMGINVLDWAESCLQAHQK